MKSNKKVFLVTAEKFVEFSILANNKEEVLDVLSYEDFEDWGYGWDLDVGEISEKQQDAEYFIDKDGYLDEMKNFVEEPEEDNPHEPGKYDVQLPF